jgi:hypothetical protein
VAAAALLRKITRIEAVRLKRGFIVVVGFVENRSCFQEGSTYFIRSARAITHSRGFLGFTFIVVRATLPRWPRVAVRADSPKNTQFYDAISDIDFPLFLCMGTGRSHAECSRDCPLGRAAVHPVVEV